MFSSIELHFMTQSCNRVTYVALKCYETAIYVKYNLKED